MICADCGILSRDPVGDRVICLSCARLIADVGRRAGPRRGPRFGVVTAFAVIIFALVVASLWWGCSSTTPPPPSPIAAAPPPAPPAPPVDAGPPPAQRETRTIEPPGGTGGLPGEPVVAARVFAFADSQLHHLFGKRTFAQSPFADRFSFEVAVRPAALDDGSDLLLDLFIREQQRFFADHSLVFLGDASDLSCQQELDAFTAVLANAGVDRFLSLTSNHDGFFVGNFTSARDHDGELVITDMPHDWTRACSEPGSFADHRLTKGRAVAKLAGLLPSGPPWATSVSHLGAEGPQSYAKTHLYYVRPLAGGDQDAPPAWGVFLDTVDYRDFDLRGSSGAGSNGAISHQQLRFLDRAMFEAAALSTRPTHFLLFGHHPFDELEPASRKRLVNFLAVRPEITAYVSAHTHVSIERDIELPDGRKVAEIVIGSTTDAPQSARILELQVGPDGRPALASWRLVIDNTMCSAVTPQPPTALGYTGYRILRDGTPDVTVSTFEKLTVLFGSNLRGKRIVQALGAIVVENELVRSWAKLYADSPLALPGAIRAELADIVARRYARADDFASLAPWLQGRAQVDGEISAYDGWHDPVTARVVRIAALGVHRFGANVVNFRRLRAERNRDDEARRYFLCHAVHAAAAEERRPRRSGNILYIR